jgi:uncharacterized protein (TIGR02118 family)
MATALPMSSGVPGLVFTGTFDSMADLQQGLSSPEGTAAAADIANFATGGAVLLTFEEQPV